MSNAKSVSAASDKSTMSIRLRRQLMAEFPKWSKPPSGYVEWHEWANAQELHGLKQSQCARCRLWLFPQEVDMHPCIPPKARRKKK